MNSLLVTGGAGFIGSNFVYYWRRAHPDDRLVVLDALTYAGNPANLEPLAQDDKFHFAKGDICDADLLRRLFSTYDFKAVIHFAAESHVDRSIVASDAFIRTNIVGTHTLLQASMKAWEKTLDGRRFHHISTDEVYGSLAPDDPPFTETNPYSPRSPYSASKAASDHLVRSWHSTYGLPVTISNCSNNYGPFQFPEKLIPLVLMNALEGRPLPVYGDGGNVRDWLHVADHCAAIDAILHKGKAGEIYNVGGAGEISNIDVVRRLCVLVNDKLRGDSALRRRFPNSPAAQGRDCGELIAFVKDRPGHDRRYAMDATKIERELGFQPKSKFDDGLAQTVDWYIANEEWWRALQKGELRNWNARHYGWAFSEER
jgi:dTDP-glucose 4,6-dehydratase